MPAEAFVSEDTPLNLIAKTLRMETRHIEVWGQKEEEEDNEDEQVWMFLGRKEAQNVPRQLLWLVKSSLFLLISGNPCFDSFMPSTLGWFLNVVSEWATEQYRAYPLYVAWFEYLPSDYAKFAPRSHLRLLVRANKQNHNPFSCPRSN